MVNGRLDWNGDAAIKAIMDAAWEAVLRATVLFWKELQVVLSVPAAWLGKQRIPSKPGEPPRKRTGWGAKHVTYELQKEQLTTRVGLLRNALYMAFLESGTATILPRPWFLVTLKKLLPQLRNVIGTVSVK